MNILVIGCGGRECAIIKSLLKSENNLNIYVLGEYINPGILQMTKGFKVITNFNVTELLNFIEKITPRFVVVGPEKYLDLRVGEILYNQNIPCIGPMGIMAKIETSKIFCRQFLKEKYSKLIQENKGNLVQTQEWGLLNLSYLIKKNKKGNYIHFKIKGNGELIKELEKNERIDKNLLRYVTIRVKKFDLKENYFGKDEVEDTKNLKK